MRNNTVIELDGTKWLVREAESIETAHICIANARVTGSVGSKLSVNNAVKADVVRLDSAIADATALGRADYFKFHNNPYSDDQDIEQDAYQQGYQEMKEQHG